MKDIYLKLNYFTIPKLGINIKKRYKMLRTDKKGKTKVKYEYVLLENIAIHLWSTSLGFITFSQWYHVLEGFCKIPHPRKDKIWQLKLAVWKLERLQLHYYHNIF